MNKAQAGSALPIVLILLVLFTLLIRNSSFTALLGLRMTESAVITTRLENHATQMLAKRFALLSPRQSPEIRAEYVRVSGTRERSVQISSILLAPKHPARAIEVERAARRMFTCGKINGTAILNPVVERAAATYLSSETCDFSSNASIKRGGTLPYNLSARRLEFASVEFEELLATGEVSIQEASFSGFWRIVSNGRIAIERVRLSANSDTVLISSHGLVQIGSIEGSGRFSVKGIDTALPLPYPPESIQRVEGSLFKLVALHRTP